MANHETQCSHVERLDFRRQAFKTFLLLVDLHFASSGIERSGTSTQIIQNIVKQRANKREECMFERIDVDAPSFQSQRRAQAGRSMMIDPGRSRRHTYIVSESIYHQRICYLCTTAVLARTATHVPAPAACGSSPRARCSQDGHTPGIQFPWVLGVIPATPSYFHSGRAECTKLSLAAEMGNQVAVRTWEHRHVRINLKRSDGELAVTYDVKNGFACLP